MYALISCALQIRVTSFSPYEQISTKNGLPRKVENIVGSDQKSRSSWFSVSLNGSSPPFLQSEFCSVVMKLFLLLNTKKTQDIV